MYQAAIEGYRLSPQQRRVWLLQRGGGAIGPYRVVCALRIDGHVDKLTFKAALQKVVSRQEILRTNFRSLPGMPIPVQVISDDCAPIIREHDLAGLNAQERDAEIGRLFEEAKELPFDLENGPVMWLSLIRVSPAEHIAVVAMPALCADTATLKNLAAELAEAYAACSRCAELPGDAVQYADLTEWQNELLECEETATEREFWLRQNIADISVQLPYPDRAADDGRFYPGVHAPTVRADLYEKLEEVATGYGVSTSTFLLACWQLLLFRLTGQADMVIGISHDGRAYDGLQEALGPFARYLPGHCQLRHDTRMVDLLKRVHVLEQDLVEWQDYFGWELISGLGRDVGESFFSICFDFHEAGARRHGHGVEFSIDKIYACVDRFKVKLSCVVNDRRLLTELHYDAGSYDACDIKRLAEAYVRLVERTVLDPEALAGEYEILGDSEREKILTEFNRTETAFGHERCLHHLIEEQVDRTPDKVAAICDDHHLTYSELNARANQLAHYLKSAGVLSEARVAICLDRSLEMILGVLGTIKAGGAFVPIDESNPAERFEFMLGDAGACALLTRRGLLSETLTPGVRVIHLDSDWQDIAKESSRNPDGDSTIDNLAYIIYTSGSTGRPKGVMIQHRSLVNYLSWVNRALLADAALTCPMSTSLTFDASLKQLFAPLMRGGLVWAIPRDTVRDPHALVDAISLHNNIAFNCVPSFWRAILGSTTDDHVTRLNDNLHSILIGGEQAGKDLIEKTLNKLPNLRIWNLYGPTEATANASAGLISAGEDLTIGRPIDNTEIVILDDQLRLLPLWVAGQLHIGGEGLARGYENRPDTTAERFIPHPFSNKPGSRLYRSGDLASYRSDGSLDFLGRLDHQVKIRGYRIELAEIESVITQHPEVDQAVVAVREDNPGDRHLVAYVVWKEGAYAKELREYLRAKLPEYMVPSAFVELERMPLTANGKLDRKALPEPAIEQAATEEDQPRTPVEEILCSIWADVLRWSSVGRRQDFFELGGHSLLATQVVSRMREAFDVEVPLKALFERPTVAGLAEAVERERGAGRRAEAPPIVAVSRDRQLPLSFAQQRLWFIHQLDPDSAAYNIPRAVRLVGELDVSAIRSSLRQIVARHEVLRTRFVAVADSHRK